jgi:hypothetical protein
MGKQCEINILSLREVGYFNQDAKLPTTVKVGCQRGLSTEGFIRL